MCVCVCARAREVVSSPLPSNCYRGHSRAQSLRQWICQQWRVTGLALLVLIALNEPYYWTCFTRIALNKPYYWTCFIRKVKSSMDRSLPVENLLAQNVWSIINYLQ